MKKNRIKGLLTAVVLLSGLSSTSAWGQTMVVYSSNGSEAGRYALAETTRMIFGEESMTVKTADTESATFSLGQIRCIKFEDPTSIQGITTSTAKLRARLSGDFIVVEGLSGETADARIVALNGSEVMLLNRSGGQPINVASLPHGIYILRVKDLSFKFVK